MARNILYDYAMSHLGKPYLWGGDDFTGYDCSGLCIEILKSDGRLKPSTDMTAQRLYEHFKKTGSPAQMEPKLGALAFYGETTKAIKHVGMVLDKTKMIEAGGGRRTTKTTADAAKHNAFVRIRPIHSRSDFVAMLDTEKE